MQEWLLKRHLYLRPDMGMAGDMFISGLLGFGLPVDRLTAIMERAASKLGGASVQAERHELRRGIPAIGLTISLRENLQGMRLETARFIIQTVMEREAIHSPYFDFALRALDILGTAEKEAHRKLDGLHHTDHHVHLHEAQDIVMDVVGASWALQYLSVDLETVHCVQPVRVGGGIITFSHGTLPVPAPATTAILAEYDIPWEPGPGRFEQLTPTGAAILAALNPKYIFKDGLPPNPRRLSLGKGTIETEPPNVLRLYIDEEQE